MKHLLSQPLIYQLYQELGGFFGARVAAIRDYLPMAAGARVIDIGCGPGHIVQHLAIDIDYVGLDIDPSSIAYANAHFGGRGRFQCRFFDAVAARELGPADIVMMNGVMHHIPDAELVETLAHVRDALKPDGVLFTLDGCYVPGQSRLDKWLLDKDRGAHVRDEAGYRSVLGAVFAEVDMHIRDDYARLPYTFALGLARKQADPHRRAIVQPAPERAQ
jgi:SAM-dependent methyltransferase